MFWEVVFGACTKEFSWNVIFEQTSSFRIKKAYLWSFFGQNKLFQATFGHFRDFFQNPSVAIKSFLNYLNFVNSDNQRCVYWWFIPSRYDDILLFTLKIWCHTLVMCVLSLSRRYFGIYEFQLVTNLWFGSLATHSMKKVSSEKVPSHKVDIFGLFVLFFIVYTLGTKMFVFSRVSD